MTYVWLPASLELGRLFFLSVARCQCAMNKMSLCYIHFHWHHHKEVEKRRSRKNAGQWIKMKRGYGILIFSRSFLQLRLWRMAFIRMAARCGWAGLYTAALSVSDISIIYWFLVFSKYYETNETTWSRASLRSFFLMSLWMIINWSAASVKKTIKQCIRNISHFNIY